MKAIQYRRDLPDGTQQYSREHMRKPDEDQKYFDDMIRTRQEKEPREPLEFLFFGREQSYPNRVLDRKSEDYILHYVTRGSGTYNGRRISAGEGFLIVPGIEHHMASDGEDPWHFKWISFRGSHAKGEMKQIGLDGEHPYFTFGFARRLEELFEDVIYRDHSDCEINTYMQGIFYLILSYHKKEYQTERETGANPYALAAMRYMDAHYREDLRIDALARSLHISRKYLCALLTREIGMSTKEYLLRRRTEAASELLLHTGMTVEEIGQEVGYADYTQFSRMFRQKTGCSPQQFRKQQGEQRGSPTTKDEKRKETTMKNTKRAIPELLSPAGNFEKLKAAILYGADAVYLAGTRFGMRSAADNFTDEELREAVEYVHERGKKLYLTLNTMPHGEEYPALRAFLERIRDFGIDAVIVADLGVLATVREIIPEMEIHVSTQASIVSPQAARAWAALGAKRLVLARELTLPEIRAIREALPSDVELEAFIHGSMCVSYSGRCMLSHNLTGRDANRGACTQPCRWVYTVTEEKRPDTPFPIEQNELGTFVMSSKDMCTIGIIPQLMESGINSFKIEGRMKSAYYTAVVTNAYRLAMDAYAADPEGYEYRPEWLRELESVSHREYCAGYYLESPMENAQLSGLNGYIREKAYFATALEADALTLPSHLKRETERGILVPFIQRNKVCVGDVAELISPNQIGRSLTVTELYDEEGAPIESAPHPSMKFWARIPIAVTAGDIMRSGG